MNTPPLILASASPRRAALLRAEGIECSILPAQVDEIESEQLTPVELCLVNAYRKARCVAKKHPDALVLGADTLVCQGLQVFGKPRDLEHARSMLEHLAGQTHEVVTGVCLLYLREHRQRMFAERTVVTFRALQPADIQQYLSRINPLDKAGAYAIQEHGDLIVEQIEGSYSNVVGLPIERLKAEMQHWGTATA